MKAKCSGIQECGGHCGNCLPCRKEHSVPSTVHICMVIIKSKPIFSFYHRPEVLYRQCNLCRQFNTFAGSPTAPLPSPAGAICEQDWGEKNPVLPWSLEQRDCKTYMKECISGGNTTADASQIFKKQNKTIMSNLERFFNIIRAESSLSISISLSLSLSSFLSWPRKFLLKP